MPRKARIDAPGAFYHIVQEASCEEKYFSLESSRQKSKQEAFSVTGRIGS